MTIKHPDKSTDDLVDPDPVALASLAIAVGAFVIQLADYYRKSPEDSHLPAQFKPGALNVISKLEEAVEDVEKCFRNVARIAERGSQDVERELYAAPMRVAQMQLLMPKQDNQEFASSLASAFQKTGTLGLWVATIMNNHPEVAHFIGKELGTRAIESAERYNLILSEGRSIRDILGEAKILLQTLREIVAKIIDRN